MSGGRSHGPLSESRRAAFDEGGLWSEMNTILGRIRRRASGEPTAKEKARLAELKERIAQIRKGGE